mmetsp:Transcript_20565/g.60058  ORF Transcript_20565/g.60058 Transcript_20565/m.60058 type:complete len:250 (+) Transcript_20565:688-1437(+)
MTLLAMDCLRTAARLLFSCRPRCHHRRHRSAQRRYRRERLPPCRAQHPRSPQPPRPFRPLFPRGSRALCPALCLRASRLRCRVHCPLLSRRPRRRLLPPLRNRPPSPRTPQQMSQPRTPRRSRRLRRLVLLSAPAAPTPPPRSRWWARVFWISLRTSSKRRTPWKRAARSSWYGSMATLPHHRTREERKRHQGLGGSTCSCSRKPPLSTTTPQQIYQSPRQRGVGGERRVEVEAFAFFENKIMTLGLGI